MKVVALAFLALVIAWPAHAGAKKHKKKQPPQKAAPRQPVTPPRPREKEKTAMA